MLPDHGMVIFYGVLPRAERGLGGHDMAQEQLPHKLTLSERNRLTVTGVTEVISFDDGAVLLQTNMGSLTVQGDGLQLKNLSLEGGQVEVDGTIASMTYGDPARERGWLSRLLG